MSEPMNQVILNFLDRMIDEFRLSAEAAVALRSVIAEQRNEQKESINDIRDDLEKIIHHFSNGFKSELKEHISSSSDETLSLLEELKKLMETEEEKKLRLAHYERFKLFLDKVQSPKFWAALIVSALVAIGTTIGAVTTALNAVQPYLAHKTAVTQPAPQLPPAPTTTNPGSPSSHP